VPGPVVVGVGLAAGGGALAGLAGWQHGVAVSRAALWHGGTVQKGGFDEVEGQLRAAEDARLGLGIGAGALAAGSAVAFVASAARAGGSAAAGPSLTPSLAWSPTGGLVVGIGGAW
jgi:hypothetical protein